MDAKQVWRAALGELQVSLSPANYETWLRDTSLVDVDDNRFRIAVPNGFAKDWLETRYRSLITQTLARIVGYSVQVEFVVRPPPRRTAAGGDRRPAAAAPRQPAGPARGRRASAARAASTNLNPRYTFANFIVGSANRLAHAASLSVAERPGHAYNPLFLYGGVGLGKTHLMHAIGNQVIARFPRKRVVYATSEKFTNEFITSIQQGKIDEFRARYRRIDLLLIDDIQFIADKERTQEEFFHTFNAIHEDGKQIVLSLGPAAQGDPHARGAAAQPLRVGPDRGPDRPGPRDPDRHPAGQGRGAGRSRSRSDVIEFIARKVVSNIRELEGALNRIVAYASMGARADHDRARPGGPLERPLQPQEAPGHARSGSPGPCPTTTASPIDALKGQKRDKAIVVPRQIAMFLMREETDVSLLRIGAELGGRDHSTVLHACDKINREIGRQRRAAPRDRRRPRADLRRLRPTGRRGRAPGSTGAGSRAGARRGRMHRSTDPVDNGRDSRGQPRAAVDNAAPVAASPGTWTPPRDGSPAAGRDRVHSDRRRRVPASGGRSSTAGGRVVHRPIARGRARPSTPSTP